MDLLSLCVVAYNEEAYLPDLLSDFQKQQYFHQQIEIVLVDSGSTDSTKKIMTDFQKSDHDFSSVQVLDNPKRNQASGWNVAIQNANGSVISRIDAHSKVSPEFSLYVMEDIGGGESIVGGQRPALVKMNSAWSRTLLSVENSLFGSSINKSRRSQKKEYVKTMFHASYRREVFDKAGLFDESLLRTEDNELHYRMRQCGYRFLYDPRIVSYQYIRESFRQMVRQKFLNGYWIGITAKRVPGCLSLYHFVPCIFFLANLVSLILFLFGHPVCSLLLLLLYGSFCIINTVINSIKDGFNVLMLTQPFLFYVLHMSYGLGTLLGLLSLAGNRRT